MDAQRAGVGGEGRKRLTREDLLGMARRFLAGERRGRGARALWARAAGTDVRTFARYLRVAREGKALPVLWRPPEPEKQDQARALVEELRDLLPDGSGWRPCVVAIEKAHPDVKFSVQGVQRAVKEKKAGLEAARQAAHKKAQQAIEEKRVAHDLQFRDAVWGEDRSFVGREPRGEVGVEEIRDQATTKILALEEGFPPTSLDVIDLLKRTAAARGGLPLVLQDDNASVYVSRETEAFLAQERTVHLLSRVARPTDNPGTERGLGEMKGDCGIVKGVPVEDPWEAAARLQGQQRKRDAALPRASRGWWTADELDAALPRADDVVDREAFYRAACSAKAKAVEGVADPGEARRRERDAVFATLVQFGLATKRRGRRRLARVNEARAAAPLAR